MYDLTPEQSDDAQAIEALLDRAFGLDRRKKVSYRYREGVDPIADYSLVARDGDELCGTIRYWPIRAGTVPALLLGPIAVEPSLHSQGIGRALIHATLARVRAKGAALVFLVGDPSYYRQFGFDVVPPRIVMPDEDPGRLQWLGLRGAALPERGCRLQRWTSSSDLPVLGGIALPGGTLIEPSQRHRQDIEQILVAQHGLRHLA
jgi:predicted N-acetyltransferase YhbS